jgi:hypothetical protein
MWKSPEPERHTLLGLMRSGFRMANAIGLMRCEKPHSGDPNKAQVKRSAALG